MQNVLAELRTSRLAMIRPLSNDQFEWKTTVLAVSVVLTYLRVISGQVCRVTSHRPAMRQVSLLEKRLFRHCIDSSSCYVCAAVVSFSIFCQNLAAL
jgi:hypothetical protein